MTRTASLILAVILATSALAAEFTVNAGETGKRVFPLNGVNAGPAHMKGQHAMDLTAQYQEMGISLVRTHDYYGYIDLSNIFPHSWDTDPANHGNYDFSGADDVINEVEAAGCDVMFRLGESWYTPSHNQIPSNHANVAHVCKHIIMHYGGDDCNPYNCRIRLWEFWNEPNLDKFWDVKADPNFTKFFSMYGRVAYEVKRRFPHIQLGGPGTAGSDDAGIEKFARQFVQALRDNPHDPPLDFYSWHSYNRDNDGPYVFARQAQKVRAVLNAAGFAKTENVLSEWNSSSVRAGGQHPTEEDLQWRHTLFNIDGAAFSAAALIYMHLYSDIRYACRYRGDIHSGDEGYGLMDTGGNIKKPGYAFKAYAGLFPQREWRKMYLLSGTGGDTGNEGKAGKCRAMMATTDEDRTVVNVLIALWEHGNEGFSLTVSNLPDGWQQPMMEHYVVSQKQDYYEQASRSIAQQYARDKAYRYTCKQVPDTTSSVHLVRLYDAAKFPTLQPTGVQPATGPQPPQQPRPFPPIRRFPRPWPPRPGR